MADRKIRELEDLKVVFLEAASHVRKIASKLTENQLLHFYGYYKQAVEGPCTKKKPSWLQISEKQKWQAWSSLGSMGTEESMQMYINLLNSIDTNWRDVNECEPHVGSWIHHSSLRNTDEELDDCQKTVFDWVKENNIIKVMDILKNGFDVNARDEEGLSLLHWAADRGSLEIVKHLIEDWDADINIRDDNGQTALHYASSCGHEEVLKLLLKSGCDANIEDSDGQIPLHIANCLDIEKVFETFKT